MTGMSQSQSVSVILNLIKHAAFAAHPTRCPSALNESARRKGLTIPVLFRFRQTVRRLNRFYRFSPGVPAGIVILSGAVSDRPVVDPSRKTASETTHPSAKRLCWHNAVQATACCRPVKTCPETCCGSSVCATRPSAFQFPTPFIANLPRTAHD